MNILTALRLAVVFVLCIVAWYLSPWPVALLLTVLAVNQEMYFLMTRRLICFVSTIQKFQINTPPSGADNGQQTG